jgi:hypothetical protein
MAEPVIKCAYTKLIPINELKSYSKNRNKHPQEQITRLAKLIEAHGLRHPIIVSTLSNEVVAGNGRLEALKQIGATQVPVDFQDFKDQTAEYAFSVSDNAVALWAELDLSGINTDLPDLGNLDLDLLGIKDFHHEIIPATEQPVEETIKDKKQIICQACGEVVNG